MIPKILGICSAFVCLHVANGASFSKVYVQSGGPEVVPVEYVNYGAPAVYAEPQIAQLSASPLGSVVSVPSVSSVIPPCVSPCVVGQNIAPVAQVPSAKFITYNAPNVPVVVAPSKDNGYEYSYVVYDESTGDRKAQREFSDGAVVRGEYSFIQPDGYVREVQYRADDLTGFNVVVKRILPESVGVVEKKDPPPCKEVKSEALKVEPHGHAEDHGHVAPAPSHDDHDHDGNGVPDHHPSEHTEPEPAHDDHDHDGDGVQDHHPSEHAEPEPAHEDHDHDHDGTPDHEPTEHAEPEPAHDDHDHDHDGTPDHPPSEHAEPEPAHDDHEHDHDETPDHESMEHPEPAHEEHHEEAHAPASEAEPEHAETHEAIVVHEEHPEVVPAPVNPIPVPETPASNLLVSYDDIIRCIQSKAQSPQGLNLSPLTYILLPAANRPC